MGHHRAARPVKRNAMIGVAAVAVLFTALNPSLESGQVPWAPGPDEAPPVAAARGAAAPVDPAAAALEMAQAAQRGEDAEPVSAPTQEEQEEQAPAAPQEVPDATISGLVRGPDGRLLDDVVVEAVAVQSASSPTGEELTYAPVAATVLSAADDVVDHGAYELEVPPGRYVVRFRAAPGTRPWVAAYLGSATGSPVRVTPGQELVVDEQQMQLGRAVTVRGLAWDEDSAMVSGAVVQLVRREGAAMVPVDYAVSDDAGAFEFPLATRGEQYTVRIRGGATADGDVLSTAHAWLGDVTEAGEARWLPAGEGAEKVTLGPIRMVERIEAVTPPSIEGDVRVGETLEVADGTWNTPADASPEEQPGLVHQWFVDGEEVPGAVSRSYTPAPEDLDKVVGVRVRATADGRSATSYATPALVRRAAPPVADEEPSIDGDPQVGQRLRLDVGSWSASSGAAEQAEQAGGRTEVDLAVAWQRDGIWIPGAVARTYRVRSRDVGHEITAVVAASVGASQTVRVAAEPLRVENRASSVTVTRTGGVLRVQVQVDGDGAAVGEVLVVASGSVLARRDLAGGDGGVVEVRGSAATDGTSVVFLGDAGTRDAQALLR